MLSASTRTARPPCASPPSPRDLCPPVHSVSQATLTARNQPTSKLQAAAPGPRRPAPTVATLIQLLVSRLHRGLWVPLASPPVLLPSVLRNSHATPTQEGLWNPPSAAPIWQNPTATPACRPLPLGGPTAGRGAHSQVLRSSAPSGGPCLPGSLT